MQFILIGILLNLVVGAAQASDSINGSLNTNNNNDSTNSYNTTDSTLNSNNVTNNYSGSNVNNEASNKTVTNNNQNNVRTNQVQAPTLSNLTTSGADTCLGSVTGGISVPGFSGAGGKTVVDENCEMLKQVKLMASLGLKDAAVCLMYQADEKFATAIKAAYPQLRDLCDPQAIEERKIADAEQARLDKLAQYERAGLEPPAHLLEPVQQEVKNENNWYYDEQGRKCTEGFVPFTNIKTKSCH